MSNCLRISFVLFQALLTSSGSETQAPFFCTDATDYSALLAGALKAFPSLKKQSLTFRCTVGTHDLEFHEEAMARRGVHDSAVKVDATHYQSGSDRNNELTSVAPACLFGSPQNRNAKSWTSRAARAKRRNQRRKPSLLLATARKKSKAKQTTLAVMTRWTRSTRSRANRNPRRAGP